MRPRIHARTLLVLTVVALGWAQPLVGQVPDPDPERFADDFAAFARWDAKNYVPRDAIVFTGSSSIVRWNTAEYLPGLRVINRGFGGSHIADVVHWVDQAVIQYDPAIVVHYAGDNDLGRGKTSHEVYEDYVEFAEAVLEADPYTEIVFLSIKPSLARWEYWSAMQETNAMVRQFAQTRPNLHYVDVGTRMLGNDGQPIPELFVRDGLHMTPAGYEIWTDIVGPFLAGLD